MARSAVGMLPRRQCRHRRHLATRRLQALSSVEDFRCRDHQSSRQAQLSDRRRIGRFRNQNRNLFRRNRRDLSHRVGARCRHSFFSPFGLSEHNQDCAVLIPRVALVPCGQKLYRFVRHVLVCTCRVLFLRAQVRLWKFQSSSLQSPIASERHDECYG